MAFCLFCFKLFSPFTGFKDETLQQQDSYRAALKQQVGPGASVCRWMIGEGTDELQDEMKCF